MTNRSSGWLTNRDATPSVATDPAECVGELKSAIGYIANAADDASASIFRFVTVPSNARIEDVLLTTGDATTAGAIDVGVYRTVNDGGAVVDADLFASALALTGGPFVDTSVRDESTNYTLAERAGPLWAALGLTADPGIMYDIAATVTTTFNGAAVGTLLKVVYID